MTATYSLPITVQHLIESLSMDDSGLLHSSEAEDAELIEHTNGILQASSPDSGLLISLLRDIIYRRIYLTPQPVSEREKDIEEGYQNSLSGGVKSKLFQRLHHCNRGMGYADPHWQIVAFEPDQMLRVYKQGLTLWVSPTKHLIPALTDETVGDYVSIRMPKNVLDPGIYVAVGNAGQVQPRGETEKERISQLHFNFDAVHAPAILEYWTTVLNELALPFCFAVGHESCNYERHDPGILLFAQKDLPGVIEVLKSFLEEHRGLLRDGIPIFTQFIASGVAYAEHPGVSQFSFHLYRCHLIAQGLLRLWQGTQGCKPNLQTAIAAIESCFEEQGLNWQKPYLNSGSQSIDFRQWFSV